MISVVIPILDESENVKRLHEELTSVLQPIGDFEIIYVNDGSTDASGEELKKLKPARVITFRRTFGQTAAFDAGLKAVEGDLVITMDGDLQNDPKDIPALLKKLDEGYDVVCGWRHDRKESFGRKFISWGARFVRKTLLGDAIHDSGCSLRVYRRVAVDNLDMYGEMHRLITAILTLRGYKITELKVNDRPRIHGKTKYNWRRSVKSFVDMINLWFLYKYRARPLHLFGGLGLVIFTLGSILTTYFVIARVFFDVQLAGRTLPIGALFLVLFGLQLFVTGMISDIMMKSYHASSKDKSYFIESDEKV